MTMHPLRKTPVSVTVGISLVVITTLSFGIFGAVSYHQQRNRELEYVRIALVLDADQIAPGLALPVWNLDHTQIDKIVESMMFDPILKGIEIRSADDQSVICARQRNAQGNITAANEAFSVSGGFVEKRAISFTNETIATVTLWGTTKVVDERMGGNLRWIIYNILWIDSVLFIGTYLLFRFSVFKPLREIEAYAAAVSIGGNAVQVPPFGGELERLRLSIEKMFNLLNMRYQALLDSEEKFSKAFKANPSGIAISEMATGRYIEVNESFCTLTGYAPEALIGRTSLELGIWKNGEERHHAFQPLLTGGWLRDQEVQIQTRAGVTKTVRINAELIELGGKRCIVALIEDITDRKRAQDELLWKTAFLEAQVDSSLDGILVVDARTKRIFQNERLFQLFKVPDAIARDDDDNPLLQHVLRQAKNPRQFSERIAHLYACPDEIGRDEIELVDGTILDRYSAPVRGKEGKYYGRIWAFRDITGQRQLEEQFRQAQKMEAIGTLAGGIAHDFNNILAAINGYIELAKMRVTTDPVANKYLEAVLQGGARAVALVRQILTFSHRQEEQRLPVQLRHLVAEPLNLLRATIPSSIEFEVSLASDLPAVLADATQIHQIVMNLCTNAAHAMKGRPGTLGVRLAHFAADAFMARSIPGLSAGPYVRLSISDSGCGMSQSTLSRIFEPFFTTKAPGEGTGLGLSVVHGIMQSHGGAISVYSTPGEGTVFHLYFPVTADDASPVEDAATETPAGHGERVLVVDDEKPLALLGQTMLQELGYTVENTTSPVEALALVRDQPDSYDLVVTDLTMPGMLGTDLVRELLLIRPDLPVIITTGYSATLTEQRVLEMGARALLLKPLTLHSLGVAVHRVLAKTI